MSKYPSSFTMNLLQSSQTSEVALQEVIRQVKSVAGRVVSVGSYLADTFIFQILVPGNRIGLLDLQLKSSSIVEHTGSTALPDTIGPDSAACVSGTVTLQLTALKS
jgi:hypothetical protein